jgi:hypothetical protein
LGGRGCGIVVTGNKRNLQLLPLNVNILGKAAVLQFVLALFCSWGCANSACRLLSIAMLMSSSHRLFIICSSQFLKIMTK